jgi:hypothetical protein
MDEFDPTRPRPWRPSRWQLALLAAIAAAVALAAGIVMASLVLIFTPIVLLGALALRLFGGPILRRGRPKAPAPVIDADYEVLPADEIAERRSDTPAGGGPQAR